MGMTPLGRIRRLWRNVVFDLRYGAFLGGKEPSRFAHLGASDVSNSDYTVLEALFNGRTRPDDVFVDVGCGKGRVLNWMLAHGNVASLYGLELDADVAAAVARRLRRYPQVHIVSGDAIDNLPPDGTLFYLFNPFKRPVMTRFKAAMDAAIRDPQRAARLRIIYYHPTDVDLFESDPAFEVTAIPLPPQFHKARLIRPKLAQPSPN